MMELGQTFSDAGFRLPQAVQHDALVLLYKHPLLHKVRHRGWKQTISCQLGPGSIKRCSFYVLFQSFTVGSWDGMDMCSVPLPVSNLSQTYCFLPFLAPEGKEGLEWHGLNASRLISENVGWLLALTHKTKTLVESVFRIGWCCQPHWMVHGQHPNLKMDMMTYDVWDCHY